MTEVKCEECKEWTLEANWIECEVWCSDCGTHPAFRCPKCDCVFDVVFNLFEKLERRGEEEEVTTVEEVKV